MPNRLALVILDEHDCIVESLLEFEEGDETDDFQYMMIGSATPLGEIIDEAMRDALARGVLPGGLKMPAPLPRVHEATLDAAQRELDARNAEGEDVSMLRVDPQTGAIVRGQA